MKDILIFALDIISADKEALTSDTDFYKVSICLVYIEHTLTFALSTEDTSKEA